MHLRDAGCSTYLLIPDPECPYVECSPSLSHFSSSPTLTVAALPVVVMSDLNAEKQLLLDQIHWQFRHAITYNLYTGIAYGAPHHDHSPLPR